MHWCASTERPQLCLTSLLFRFVWVLARNNLVRFWEISCFWIKIGTLVRLVHLCCRGYSVKHVVNAQQNPTTGAMQTWSTGQHHASRNCSCEKGETCCVKSTGTAMLVYIDIWLKIMFINQQTDFLCRWRHDKSLEIRVYQSVLFKKSQSQQKQHRVSLILGRTHY